MREKNRDGDQQEAEDCRKVPIAKRNAPGSEQKYWIYPYGGTFKIVHLAIPRLEPRNRTERRSCVSKVRAAW